MILSSSTPKTQLSQVRSKASVEKIKKRSSHSQSVSVFRRGVTALSSQILFICFFGFCFHSGHDTFQYPSDTFFLSLGRSLNGTFLVTPVYLHRGAPLLCRVGVAKINKVLRRCQKRTPPVPLKYGASNSALGTSNLIGLLWVQTRAL